MNNHGHPHNPNERSRKTIREWDTVEVIVDEMRPAGKYDFAVEIVVERPIFTDGSYGFERVLARIQLGDRFLRLNTKALTALLNTLGDNKSKILRAINEARNYNDNLRSRPNYSNQQTRNNNLHPRRQRRYNQ
jgi:hypothetical protein